MAEHDKSPGKPDEPVLPKEFAHLEDELRKQRKVLEDLDKQEDQLPSNRQRPAPEMKPPGSPADNQQTRGEKQNYIAQQRASVAQAFGQKIDLSEASGKAKEEAKDTAGKFFDA